MFFESLLLLAGLAVILVAAELFTNGIEMVGHRLALSQAVVGSILAAVGTALPETILPIVAILFFGGGKGHDIGVGAILGAPFMLATLAFFLVSLTVLIGARTGRRSKNIHVEYHALRRDLSFFLVFYSSAVFLPPVLPGFGIKTLAILLILGYLVYVWRTLKGESAAVEVPDHLYLWRKQTEPPVAVVFTQVLGSLAIMVGGAYLFVQSLEKVALGLGMDPLLFSLLLAPVATELPEKFNSVTWVWKERDTLAMGNITGAMVFQSTFPVSVGLLMTPWKVEGMALLSAVFALVAAALVLGEVFIRKKVSTYSVLAGGFLYLVYAVVLVLR